MCVLFFNLQEQINIYKRAHPSVDLRVTSASVGDSLLNDSTRHRAAALQLAQLFINLHHLEEEKMREAKDVRPTVTSAAETVQFTAFISKQGAVHGPTLSDLAFELVLLDVQRVLCSQVV